MDFLMPFSETKLKPNLKMAVQRMNLQNSKRTIQVKKQKKEVADLLAERKDEKARIRVEAIIREDCTMEAMEILQILLDLVHERLKQISKHKDCPKELTEAISSLVWASNYVDIEEMKEIKRQFVRKYSKEFIQSAENNDGDVVNERLFAKLTYEKPEDKLVAGYLQEIANHYGIEWDADRLKLPTGSTVRSAPASGLSSAYSTNDSPYEDYKNEESKNLDTNHEPTPEEVEEYKQFLKNQRKSTTIETNPSALNNQAGTDFIPGTTNIVYAACSAPNNNAMPTVEAQILPDPNITFQPYSAPLNSNQQISDNTLSINSDVVEESNNMKITDENKNNSNNNNHMNNTITNTSYVSSSSEKIPSAPTNIPTMDENTTTTNLTFSLTMNKNNENHSENNVEEDPLKLLQARMAALKSRD